MKNNRYEVGDIIGGRYRVTHVSEHGAITAEGPAPSQEEIKRIDAAVELDRQLSSQEISTEYDDDEGDTK